jgi:S-adenosylmethionine-diacylglycerol 3-amino-3-carboxypropyl transferase
VEETADGPFDGMNLSNIFEYMPEPFFKKVYRGLLNQLRPAGRMAYWNLHVNRQGSLFYPALVEDLQYQGEDQVPAYRAFRLEARVDSQPGQC